MDLIAVKKYLQGKGLVAMKDLALHFNRNADTIRPLLDIWMSKGKVKRAETKACGKGCCKCDPAMLELYEWIG